MVAADGIHRPEKLHKVQELMKKLKGMEKAWHDAFYANLKKEGIGTPKERIGASSTTCNDVQQRADDLKLALQKRFRKKT